MVRLWCCTLLIFIAAVPAVHAQTRVDERQLRTLMNDHLRAVEIYRAGRTAEAVARLSDQPHWLKQLVAERILQWMRDPQPQLKDPNGRPVRHWNAQLVLALASLYMEAALTVYTDRGAVQDYRAHAAGAQRLLDYLAANRLASNDVLARWTLAIGALANAEGQFWWAAEILGEDCAQHKPHVALLVACGTTHETIAGLPADVLLGAGQRRDSGLRALDLERLRRAVSVRNRHLTTARRACEDAVTIAPTNTEACLRLARVLITAGQAERSVPLLEPIVSARRETERREGFLARLFLGTNRMRARELAAAVTLFREAAELVPSAQSARVALAQALHQLGERSAAADVIQRMGGAPSKPPDPWGSYSYGQYWIPAPLLVELRAEARR